MRTIGGPNECFAICDFCEGDSSVKHFVVPIGEKGICNTCLGYLRKYVFQHDLEIKRDILL
jgi:hypothetical protein